MVTKNEMISQLKEGVQTASIKLRNARDSYLNQSSVRDAIVERENEYKLQILKDNVYMSAFEGEEHLRITEPSEAYNMSTEDHTTYLKLVHEKRSKIFHVKGGYEYTIDSEFHEGIKKSKEEFIQLMINCLSKPIKDEMIKLFNGKHFTFQKRAFELFLSINLDKPYTLPF